MYYFFISDKDNEPRRKHVLAQCKKINLPPRFYDAIMGKTMSPQDVKAAVMDLNFLSVGEIGCALTHLNLYKKLLTSSEEAVLIFEDDVVFSDDLTAEYLAELMDFVAKLDHPAVLTLCKSEYHTHPVKKTEAYSIYGADSLFLTHAYIVNRQAAKNILEFQTPLKFEIDFFKYYYWLDICNLYCLNKDFATQSNSFESGITRIFDANHRKIKKHHFKVLYDKLSLSQKINVQKKRILKHIRSLFRNKEY